MRVENDCPPLGGIEQGDCWLIQEKWRGIFWLALSWLTCRPCTVYHPTMSALLTTHVLLGHSPQHTKQIIVSEAVFWECLLLLLLLLHCEFRPESVALHFLPHRNEAKWKSRGIMLKKEEGAMIKEIRGGHVKGHPGSGQITTTRPSLPSWVITGVAILSHYHGHPLRDQPRLIIRNSMLRG